MMILLSLIETTFEKSFYNAIPYTTRVCTYGGCETEGFDRFREVTEIARVADLAPIVNRFADEAKARFPQMSFSIHVAPFSSRERKVPGFDKLVKDRDNDPLRLDRYVKTIDRRPVAA